jgi:hypothetical protein
MWKGEILLVGKHEQSSVIYIHGLTCGNSYQQRLKPKTKQKPGHHLILLVPKKHPISALHFGSRHDNGEICTENDNMFWLKAGFGCSDL